eukprot:scaffold327_cov257-Pinguiococcus_pyrenoidosus.AAC.39
MLWPNRENSRHSASNSAAVRRQRCALCPSDARQGAPLGYARRGISEFPRKSRPAWRDHRAPTSRSSPVLVAWRVKPQFGGRGE